MVHVPVIRAIIREKSSKIELMLEGLKIQEIPDVSRTAYRYKVVDIAINRNITVVKNPPHNMSTNQNKKRAREDVDDDEREDIDDAMDEEDAVNLSNGHQNPD